MRRALLPHRRSHADGPRRRGALALVLASGVLTLLAPAAPAADWVDPAPVASVPTDGNGPVIGLDGDGDAIAAWTSGELGEQRLLTATRPAGGAWSASQTLAEAPVVERPSLDVAADGDALLAWSEGNGVDSYETRVAAYDAGTWETPHDFPLVGQPATQLELRANEAGTAIVAWLEVDPDSGTVSVRAAHGSASGWSAAETVSEPADFTVRDEAPPRVRIADDGSGAVAWTAAKLVDERWRVQESRLVAGDWSGDEDIDGFVSDDALTAVELAGDGDGNAVAAWFTVGATRLMGAILRNGTWTVADLSDDVVSACVPIGAVGQDEDGGPSTVVWNEASSGDLVTRRWEDGSWQADPQSLFTPAPAEVVTGVRLNGSRAAWAINDFDADQHAVLTAGRDASGWLTPHTLATAPVGVALSAPTLARSANGDQLAAWRSSDLDGSGAITAAGFQVTAPRLTGPVVPATGTVGVAAAFSATAVSTFAPTPQLTWNFGDSSAPVAGTAVSHTYAVAGTYSVSVTATDQFGARTTAGSTIVVAPADDPDRRREEPDPDPNRRREDPPVVDPPVVNPPVVDPPVVNPPVVDPPVVRPGALVAPQPVVKGRTLRVARRARGVTLTLLNRNAVALRGSAKLVQLSGPGVNGRRARTIATQRKVALAAGRRQATKLTIPAAVLRQLRATPRRSVAVRLELSLRAPDGRTVTTRLAYKLVADGATTAPKARRIARIAC
ncbi:PKD domain-containing protein [Conexibacter stalactiti]|uniref:PKD domain-containing protein n=1 Tax=Conexibacter stalactiti TaxID=1940611 RepID=A0ABU4HYQ3_9ACTN|nr:PKD domain-containing protein [Conexibacter stalactiti]MDW5598456.1 PKD domain-containing protein [Conexibacter stalactiti]MEC5039098.1 PKD domain-containing protein [Conexibacter stalactiti]